MTETIQSFDFSVNLLQSILWQYENAKNLQSLLYSKQAWYEANQTQFWQDWIRDVFDLRTANDFGLTVWSIILGAPIFINNGPDDPSKPTWGFTSTHKNFTRGNFFSKTGNSFKLNTETARIFLQIRYFNLTTAGCIPEINRMLAYVFQDYGPCHLNDNHDMTQFYVFNFALPSELRYLLDNFDILPRPASVGSTYRVVVEETWGFDQYHENYDNGNFSEL